MPDMPFATLAVLGMRGNHCVGSLWFCIHSAGNGLTTIPADTQIYHLSHLERPEPGQGIMTTCIHRRGVQLILDTPSDALHWTSIKMASSSMTTHSLPQTTNSTPTNMAKPTVLITGCSDGGLGSALALVFHAAGHRVFATARNPAKLANANAAGIETLTLDVLSDTSIKKCVADVRQLTSGSLDILVNNAGANYPTPLADASIPDAKKLFDLNVWANLATIQAFLPLLLKSTRGGLIVNHTSIASVLCPPFTALYGASKAALAMLTVSLRAELSPFGIKVLDLKSGGTKSNINDNRYNPKPAGSKKSLYYSAREWLDTLLSGKTFEEGCTPADVWAKKVVAALSQRSPPDSVWVGAFVWTVWLGSWLPSSISQALASKASRLDLVEKSIQRYGKERAIADVYGEQ